MVVNVVHPINVTEYYPLTRRNLGFVFLAQGQLKLAVTGIETKLMQGGMLTPSRVQPRVIATVCEQSRFAFYSNTAATNSTQLALLFCGSNGIAPEVALGCSVDVLNVPTQKDESIAWNHVVQNEGAYDSFLVFCADEKQLSLRFSFEALNPGPAFVSHLGAYEIQATYIQLSFAAIWTVVVGAWFSQLVRNWNMRNKLHACISMIPVTQLAWIGYIVSRYISIGTKGPVNTDFTALFAIQSVLLFLKDFVLMFCLALLAKGWGVIRVRLSGVESRTIGGVAFFYALSDVLYSYDFDFMFVFWIFALTSYYYVLWTVLIHIQNAEKHVSLSQAKLDSLHTAPTPVLNQNNIVVDETSTVDEENAEINTNEINRNADAAVAQSNSTLRVLDRVGVLTRTNLWAQVFPPRPSFPKDAFGNRIVGMGEDWKLLWTLQSKLWVMISAKNIVIYYAFFTLIDKIIQLLGVNVIPFYPTFPNLYHLGGFYWIATVFMLRQPEQIVVIPKWVLSKRQEMGQPVSVEAEGGDERLSQVLAEMRESRPRSQFLQRIRETVQRRRGRPTVE